MVNAQFHLIMSSIYRQKNFQELLLLSVVEYRDAFTLFDEQGDGKIDCHQIGKLLRSLNLNPDDEDIRKIEKDVGK